MSLEVVVSGKDLCALRARVPGTLISPVHDTLMPQEEITSREPHPAHVTLHTLRPSSRSLESLGLYGVRRDYVCRLFVSGETSAWGAR